MAKTAKRKRKPIAATGKRGHIVDLLDLATAKTPPTPQKRKKGLQQFVRALLRNRRKGLKIDRVLALPTLRPPTPPAGELTPSPKQRRKAGAKPKYDWDAIHAHCHQWFDDNGCPENVSAFCRDEIIPWCEQRYGEDGTPDMETMRPLVTKWMAAWQRSLLPK
jgi:hypothetical protein